MTRAHRYNDTTWLINCLGFNPESCIGSFSSDRFILEGCVSVANRAQLYNKTSDVIDEDLKVGFFAT